MLYVGIDPGEEWCGVGILSIGRKEIIMDAAVYNVSDHTYLALAAKIAGLPRWSDERPTIIIEDYHVRPVGHQSFTRGMTLRLIGALEYACALNNQIEFEDFGAKFVNPGKPEEAISIFGAALNPWDNRWLSDTRWKHALSAWRVIGMYLLKKKPDEIKRIRSLKDLNRQVVGGGETSPGDNDLHADTLTWIAPAQLKRRS